LFIHLLQDFVLQFSLQPYEFLTQIEGYYGVTHFTNKRNGDGIHALTGITFHTNLKKVHGLYGGGKEPNFTHFQSSVGKIVGFFGKTGDVVDQLGVFMESKGMFLTIIFCWVGILFFETPTSAGPSHLGESLGHSLYQNQAPPYRLLLR
jgi:hypothetical protein